MKKSAVTLFLFFILTGLILNFSSGYADSGGTTVGYATISPAAFEFDNVRPGGYAEMTVRISATKKIPVYLSAAGPIEDWLSFSIAEIEVEKDEPITFKIFVRPQSAAAVGTYRSHIVITTLAQGSSITMTGFVSKTLEVAVSITKQKIMELAVEELVIDDVEIGQPIELKATLQNKGNIIINPLIKSEISSFDYEENLLMVNYTQSMLPTSRINISVPVQNNLSIGKYKARTSVFLDGLLTKQVISDFEILSPGALPKKGSLKELIVTGEFVANKSVQVVGVFENAGAATEAKLEVLVEKDGQLVERLESLPMRVGKGEAANLIVAFLPSESGSYSLASRVHFNGKTTPTNYLNIEIRSPHETPLLSGLTLLIFLFIFTIVVLKLRQRKRFKQAII